MTETSAEKEIFYFPNKMGRILLLSLEEVIGHNGVNAVLKLAGLTRRINNYPPNTFDLDFPFEEISRIQVVLEDMYGPRGGRGVALRAGRAAFKYGLREFGSVIGVADLAFRLLPLKMKLQTGAEVMADTFNRYTDQIVRVEETPHVLKWMIERCPMCWDRKTDTPCCHLSVGVIQEALFWVSGGKNFMVEEITCIGQGDETCTMLITRQPLD